MKSFLIFFLLFFLSGSLVSAQTNTTEDSPTLVIISPKNNEQIFGSKVTVSFIVKNFIFTDPSVRNKNETGEGHLNVWLDEQNPESGNAQKIVRATDFTLEEIKPGNHQLILELVNNNDTPLNPSIREVVNFTTIAAKEIPTVTEEAVRNIEDNKMKKAQRLTSLSSLFAITLVTITLITALGFIIFNRVLNK